MLSKLRTLPGRLSRSRPHQARKAGLASSAVCFTRKQESIRKSGGDTIKQVGEDEVVINKDKISPHDEDEGIRDSPYANAVEKSQYDGGVDAEAGALGPTGSEVLDSLAHQPKATRGGNVTQESKPRDEKRPEVDYPPARSGEPTKTGYGANP